MVKKTSKQTLGEELANSISHGIMAAFGVVAMILLILKSDSTRDYIGAIIFGFGIIMLYTMSTLYHAFPSGKVKRLFRRFDHLSIYILIGGTFAPPLLLISGLQKPLFGITGMPEIGITLFAIQWLMIVVGVVFKSIWVKRFMKLHVFLFLAMGWSALTFANILVNENGPAFWWILAGGVAYSVGVIFFALSKVKYFHFIWHIFTALGTLLQFIAIYHFLY